MASIIESKSSDNYEWNMETYSKICKDITCNLLALSINNFIKVVNAFVSHAKTYTTLRDISRYYAAVILALGKINGIENVAFYTHEGDKGVVALLKQSEKIISDLLPIVNDTYDSILSSSQYPTSPIRVKEFESFED